jgi:hypothetical protein
MHPDLEQVAHLLRGLPDGASQPYGWSEFQRRARPRPGPKITAARSLAAAALVIALAVCAIAIRLASPGSGGQPTAPTAAARDPASATPVGPELRVERAADADTERYLASLPTEPTLVRVGTRSAVDTLEDHIAQVDDLLSAERSARSAPGRLLALQQERTLLVSSLAQVRYAETLAYEAR